ncbi:MAG: helix-turn-helix domain-containing protein, partial [Phycisphaerae bacterium]|nr:helix-turn-helix domain-containing protein [Phycisphaerae bacterium]
MAGTLVQIAERAGLSPATVSLALRNKNVGKKQFSPKTVSKIHRIAKEMGYRPNGMAPTLSYRLKANGTATGYVSLAANERKTSDFTIASIPAGTNVKLVIRAENKGLVFHSMKLGNALPTDFNKDGMVNLLDFAIL